LAKFTAVNALLHLRIASLLEGTSWLVLLFVAMPLKYMAGMPLAVRIVGSIHGALFIALCLLLLRCWIARGWPITRAAFCFIAALVPFGAFFLERSLKREAASDAPAAAPVSVSPPSA
jgi:integral membrane protein